LRARFQAIVDSRVLGAKLVDTVSEVVGFGTPEFVAEFAESFDAHDALSLGLLWESLEPLEQRDASVLLSVEHHRGSSALGLQ
jgi:hypothetical protein